MALVGSLFAGLAHMLMRKIANKLSFSVLPFYFATFSSVACAPVALYQMSLQPQPTHYTWEGILLIIGISFFALVAQVAASKAYQLEKAGRIAPVNNFHLLLNVLFDVMIIGSKLTV